jgi:hypothetical protein
MWVVFVRGVYWDYRLRLGTTKMEVIYRTLLRRYRPLNSTDAFRPALRSLKSTHSANLVSSAW